MTRSWIYTSSWLLRIRTIPWISHFVSCKSLRLSFRFRTLWQPFRRRILLGSLTCSRFKFWAPSYKSHNNLATSSQSAQSTPAVQQLGFTICWLRSLDTTLLNRSSAQTSKNYSASSRAKRRLRCGTTQVAWLINCKHSRQWDCNSQIRTLSWHRRTQQVAWSKAYFRQMVPSVGNRLDSSRTKAAWKSQLWKVMLRLQRLLLAIVTLKRHLLWDGSLASLCTHTKGRWVVRGRAVRLKSPRLVKSWTASMYPPPRSRKPCQLIQEGQQTCNLR